MTTQEFNERIRILEKDKKVLLQHIEKQEFFIKEETKFNNQLIFYLRKQLKLNFIAYYIGVVIGVILGMFLGVILK